ncbi:hypothetical protein C8J57DRAFT_1475392 [Mycena rebaudengoi]|nr:hypothetical protein C8J57DRAFT_1475392 [Mycena rebaudengoi]
MPSKVRIQDRHGNDCPKHFDSCHGPLPRQAATMTLSIAEVTKARIMEQIHHVLAAMIVVYETTKINGALPPAIVSEIAKFVETLRKIHMHFKAKQEKGRLRRLLNLTENGNEVKACKAELEQTLDTFRLQTHMSAASAILLMRNDIRQMHQELIDFIAAHPNSAYSDSSSEVSGTLSGTTGSIAHRGGFSLMVELLPQVMLHPGTANYGLYFGELLMLAGVMPVPIDVKACIELGNHHLDGENPLESQCEAASSVVNGIMAWPFSMGVGIALEKHSTASNQPFPSQVSYYAVWESIHVLSLTLAQKARHISQLIGDKVAGIMATCIESWCQAVVGNLLHAEKLCREAPEEYFVEEQLIDILVTKTEYQEARRKIQLAQQTLEKCLTSAQKKTDADLTDYCLLLLADIQHGLSSHRETERWAVICLAFGMTTTNRVAIAKALRCIGDLLVIDRDNDTALSLFMAALDSFTSMDIHGGKADCMIRMAAIFEQRREIRKTIDLLRRARPLYERMTVVPKDDENPLQQLAQLNVPVGHLGGPEVPELDEDAERNRDMDGEDVEG